MTAEDINATARAINERYGGRGPALEKTVPLTPALDTYTMEQIEVFAGEGGYTLDEAVAIWMKRYAVTFHH